MGDFAAKAYRTARLVGASTGSAHQLVSTPARQKIGTKRVTYPPSSEQLDNFPLPLARDSFGRGELLYDPKPWNCTPTLWDSTFRDFRVRCGIERWRVCWCDGQKRMSESRGSPGHRQSSSVVRRRRRRGQRRVLSCYPERVYDEVMNSFKQFGTCADPSAQICDFCDRRLGTARPSRRGSALVRMHHASLAVK